MSGFHHHRARMGGRSHCGPFGGPFGDRGEAHFAGGRDAGGDPRGFQRGPHGPWGRGGREGMERGPGRGRRMFGPGDLRLVLLALIEQQPRHGYDLIKAIETAFGGGYAPSAGVVYPTLSLLADEGLIAGVEDGSAKRVFSVTEAGQTWLDENRAAVDGVMQRMALAARAVSGEQAPAAVHEALHTLRHALMLKPGVWDEAETARVVAALEAATKAVGGE